MESKVCALPADAPDSLYVYDEPPVHIATKLAWTFRFLIFAVLGLSFFVGGPLVRLAVAAGAVCAVLADLDGLARHVLRVGVFAAAVYLGGAFGGVANDFVAMAFGDQYFFGVSAGAWAVGLTVFILGSIIAGRVTRGLKKRPWLRSLNHMGGALFGLGEGVASVVILYCALATFGPQLTRASEALAASENSPGVGMMRSFAAPVRRLDDFRKYLRTDPTTRWLDDHNFVADAPIVVTTQELTELVYDPEAVIELANNKEVRSIINDPELAEFLAPLRDNERLRKAYELGLYDKIVDSPQFAAVLDDPRFIKAIEQRLPEIKGALGKCSHERLKQAAKRLDKSELQRLRQVARSMQIAVR